MNFPVNIPIGPWLVSPHALFDLLAYLVGGQVYWWMRRNRVVPQPPFEKMMWVFVGMAGGAMLGAKLLAYAESFPVFWAHRAEPLVWAGGKTIAGGLIGGWIGVEIAKRWIGVRQSTGDAVVFAVAIGMAIGRLGCFLTGLGDSTHGIPSSLPFAVDFGDGIRRHPTQLYESLFVILLAWGLWRWRAHREASGTPLPCGAIFRAFIAGYLLFRVGVEYLKPREFRLGLSMSPIQVASLVTGLIAAGALVRMLRPTTAPCVKEAA